MHYSKTPPPESQATAWQLINQKANALITNYHKTKQQKSTQISKIEGKINNFVNHAVSDQQNKRKQKLSEYVQLQAKLDSLENKIQTIKSSLFPEEQGTVMAAPENKYFINIKIENNKNTHNHQNSMNINKIEVFDKGHKASTHSDYNRKDSGKKMINSYTVKTLPTLKKDPRHNYYIQEMKRVLDLSDQSNMAQLVRHSLEQSIDSAKLLITSEQSAYKTKMVKLTQKYYYSNKKTLVLDLDETLLHCNQSLDIASDVVIPIRLEGQEIQVGINIRPFAREFIKELSFYYEIIIFTASHSCYADNAIDLLDPSHEYVQHRLFREHCIYTADNVYVKDLRVINRPLDSVVLVDNASYSYGLQPNHGIPILPFYDDPLDNQLFLLCKFLKSLHSHENLPQFLEEHFQMARYKEFGCPQSLVKSLYQ